MKDNFGTFLHISDPVFVDPHGNELIYKFSVSFRDDIENKIIQEIIKEAKAEGITDVVLLNKPAIIEALKKQTAMKPKDEGWLYCPVCGKDVCVEKPKYCSDCGQKLDWSEEE